MQPRCVLCWANGRQRTCGGVCRSVEALMGDQRRRCRVYKKCFGSLLPPTVERRRAKNRTNTATPREGVTTAHTGTLPSSTNGIVTCASIRKRRRQSTILRAQRPFLMHLWRALCAALERSGTGSDRLQNRAGRASTALRQLAGRACLSAPKSLFNRGSQISWSGPWSAATCGCAG